MKKRFYAVCSWWGTYLGMFLLAAVLWQIIYFREKIIDFFISWGTFPGKGENITALGALATLLPITSFYFLWRYSFVRFFEIYQDNGREIFAIPRKGGRVLQAVWLIACALIIWKVNSLVVLWLNQYSLYVSVPILLFINLFFFLVVGGVNEFISSFRNKTKEEICQDQLDEIDTLENACLEFPEALGLTVFLLAILLFILYVVELFLLMPYASSCEKGVFSLTVGIYWSAMLGIPNLVAIFLAMLEIVTADKLRQNYARTVVLKMVLHLVVRVWLAFCWMRIAEAFFPLWLVISVFVLLLLIHPLKVVLNCAYGEGLMFYEYRLAFPFSFEMNLYYDGYEGFFRSPERMKERYPLSRYIFVFFAKKIKKRK